MHPELLFYSPLTIAQCQQRLQKNLKLDSIWSFNVAPNSYRPVYKLRGSEFQVNILQQGRGHVPARFQGKFIKYKKGTKIVGRFFEENPAAERIEKVFNITALLLWWMFLFYNLPRNPDLGTVMAALFIAMLPVGVFILNQKYNDSRNMREKNLILDTIAELFEAS